MLSNKVNIHRQKFRAGLSYVEIIMATMIMSILLVAALNLFANLGRSKTNVMKHDASTVASLDLIKEIMERNYKDPTTPTDFGADPCELIGGNRSFYDDIDDYNNLIEHPPKYLDGTNIPGYEDMTRSTKVRWVKASDFTQTSLVDQGYKEVTITLKNSKNKVVLEHVYVLADTPQMLSY